MEEAEKTASNSKKADSEVSPDKSDSALESKRKRKPNIFIDIYGKDFDCS